MSKTISKAPIAAPISPLSTTEQSQIIGGMASTDEDKTAKLKVK
jgi:hypothetical protein